MPPKDTATEFASVTVCVPEKMEVKQKAVLAKRVAYSPKDANALRPAKIVRIG